MAEGTWIDAFVTKPAKDEADAAFLGSMMSGIPGRATARGIIDKFKIRDESTHWITPRWTTGLSNYYGASQYDNLLNLKPGDLIYIGHNLGATTVRTILERKVFPKLVNKTGATINTARETDTGTVVEGAIQNGSFVAYRVDVPINATAMPTAGGTFQAQQDHADVAITLATQHFFSFPDDSMQNPDRPDANAWCPMYKLNNVHQDSRLILPLDHGVKALHCVKLIAYSSNNKSLPGYLHFHEFDHDDYIMLGIKELPASLLSNESTARGAFAALHIADTGETYEREPAGIATQYVNPGASNVRQLTLELTNRKGEPAHLGRLHLWFKLLVTHG